MMKKFAALLFIMLLAVPALAEEITTKYFTVTVPDDWKAVMPPSENQGVSTAIFAKASGTLSVSFVAGPKRGADAKSIAGMFASQFKSGKAAGGKKRPVYLYLHATERSGPGLGSHAGRRLFGDQHCGSPYKEGLEFVKKNVKSANYADMLPQ